MDRASLDTGGCAIVGHGVGFSNHCNAASGGEREDTPEFEHAKTTLPQGGSEIKTGEAAGVGGRELLFQVRKHPTTLRA